MAKKAVKESPHLRVRLDPKLVARLERAREANGNTLTGEIATRLDESFRGDDKIAELAVARDAMAADLAELRKQFADARVEIARLEQQLKEWGERRDLASAIIDTLPEDVPDPLRIMSLMLVGDPRAPEAVRSMFRAAAARARAEKEAQQ
jgi:hypothetical protein